MEAWKRTSDQLLAILRGMSALRKVSLIVVTVGVLAGIGWLALTGRQADQFLLGGRDFSAEELTRTQAAIKSAGLQPAKVVGQKLQISADQVDRYTAAALTQQALPAQFSAEFDRMQSKVNVFTSSEQRRELLEEAKKARLAQILRSIPEIEEAVVEWDRPRQTSLFRPTQQLAAHVSVKPRGGKELSWELVDSLKLFVAGALAGAKPDDVTVVDMNTSKVHGRRTPQQVVHDRLLRSAKQQAEQLTRVFTDALSDLPDLRITVQVEPLRSESRPALHKSFVGEIVPIGHSRTISQSIGSNRPAMGGLTTIHPTGLVEESDVAEAPPYITDSHRDDNQAAADDAFVDAPQNWGVKVAVSIPDSYYAARGNSEGDIPNGSWSEDKSIRADIAGIKAQTKYELRARLTELLPVNAELRSLSITTHSAPAPKAKPLEVAIPNDLQSWLSSVPVDWRVGTGVGVCLACLVWGASRLRSRPLPNTAPVAGALTETPQSDSLPATSDDSAAVESESTATQHQAAVLEKLAELESRTPSVVPSQLNPFSFLTELSVLEAGRLLEPEHPQTIALVATALAPHHAAEILHTLPELLRHDVTQRLSRIAPATPEVLCEVATTLEARRQGLGAASDAAASKLTSPVHYGAPKFESAPVAPQSMPAEASLVDPIAQSEFQFDDLPDLSPHLLLAIYESVEPRDFAVALLDQSESFKKSLLSKLPRAASSTIRQHIQHLGPVRLSDISTHQQTLSNLAANVVSGR